MKKQLLILSIAIITLLNIGCNNIAPYPIDDPAKAVATDWVLGKWTTAEKAGKEGFFEVSKIPNLKNHYHVISRDKGKKTPTFDVDVFFSKIGNTYFINIPNLDEKKVQNGYFFMRLVDAKAPYNSMSITTVQDTTMQILKSSDEVRAFITKNMDNPVFYKDTGKLVKMK